MLSSLNISIREALTLLVLFVSQVVLEFLILREYITVGFTSHDVLLAYTAVYLVLGTALLVHRRRDVGVIARLTAKTIRKAMRRESKTAGHAD